MSNLDAHVSPFVKCDRSHLKLNFVRSVAFGGKQPTMAAIHCFLSESGAGSRHYVRILALLYLMLAALPGLRSEPGTRDSLAHLDEQRIVKALTTSLKSTLVARLHTYCCRTASKLAVTNAVFRTLREDLRSAATAAVEAGASSNFEVAEYISVNFTAQLFLLLTFSHSGLSYFGHFIEQKGKY